MSCPVSQCSCIYVCEMEGEERKRGLCLIMFSVHCSQSELFIPRWSRSGELNSMFVKLMQKLPVDYYLSCILWPLRPVAKCSPQGWDSLLALLLLRLMQCLINFLHSADTWIFTASLRSFSVLLKQALPWKRDDTSQLLSCLLHHSFQPVQSTGQDLVARDYSVPPRIPN